MSLLCAIYMIKNLPRVEITINEMNDAIDHIIANKNKPEDSRLRAIATKLPFYGLKSEGCL